MIIHSQVIFCFMIIIQLFLSFSLNFYFYFFFSFVIVLVLSKIKSIKLLLSFVSDDKHFEDQTLKLPSAFLEFVLRFIRFKSCFSKKCLPITECSLSVLYTLMEVTAPDGTCNRSRYNLHRRL